MHTLALNLPERTTQGAKKGPFQRRANALGYFAHDRFEHREDWSTTDEIALNPKHFNERPPEDAPSTFVHEMAHLKQHHFGKPGRGRYHNAAWADMMEAIGLMPSSTALTARLSLPTRGL